MNGSTISRTAALLSSEGPGELIQRAALLDYVAVNEVDVLGQLQVAKVTQTNADSSARAARDERLDQGNDLRHVFRRERLGVRSVPEVAHDRGPAGARGVERAADGAQ